MTTKGVMRMASSLRRPTIAPYKSALATIGLCAVAAMGAVGFHAEASLGEIRATTAQEPPHTMTLGQHQNGIVRTTATGHHECEATGDGHAGSRHPARYVRSVAREPVQSLVPAPGMTSRSSN